MALPPESPRYSFASSQNLFWPTCSAAGADSRSSFICLRVLRMPSRSFVPTTSLITRLRTSAPRAIGGMAACRLCTTRSLRSTCSLRTESSCGSAMKSSPVAACIPVLNVDSAPKRSAARRSLLANLSLLASM